jgi:hypothetical protein
MQRSLAVACLFACLGWSCTPEVRPATSADAGLEPTPEQAEALQSALHLAHLNAEKPAVCADCHRIEGAKVLSKTQRCLGCHEKSASALHRAAASDDAKECLTCHDFHAATAAPWGCLRCHTAEGQRTRGAQAQDWASKAPLITVHAGETCKSCHAPHGESAVRPGDCAGCHESSFTAHNSALKGPAQCIECHVGHRTKEDAAERCEGCHEAQKLRLPGHTRCMSCHEPHGAGSGVRACESCHQVGHAREVLSATQPGTCKDCHDAHQNIHLGGGTGRSGPCSSCHLQAASDTAFHGRRVACVSCHAPREIRTPVPPEDLCVRCHALSAAPSVLDPVRVKTVKGHERCTTCHLQAHDPALRPPACAKCHPTEHTSAPRGHDVCADCHQTHDGALKKTCVDCHAPQGLGPHSEPARVCADCHRAHGPKGPVAPQPCTKCHAPPLPALHMIPKHGVCADCHRFHDQATAFDRASCVGACHEPQRTHEPGAQTCHGCHPFTSGGGGR